MYKEMLIALFFFNISYSVSTTTLSFDSLFPMTWYEKGLHSTIAAWHMINSLFDHSLNQEIDGIIGKCAFACFCLENMHNNQQEVVNEDIAYFSSLLDVLENRLMVCVLENDLKGNDHDHIKCLEHIVATMRNCLHIPSNINTK